MPIGVSAGQSRTAVGRAHRPADLRHRAHLVTVQLALLKNEARPVGYSRRRTIAHSSFASRTMYCSGPMIAAFVIFHLLHLTVGHGSSGLFRKATSTPTWSTVSSSGRFRSRISSRSRLLCLHLYHGIWSMFQSLGIGPSALHAAIRSAARGHRDPDCSRLHLHSARRDGRLVHYREQHGTRLQNSFRPDRTSLGQAQLRHEAGESGQQAQVQRSSWSGSGLAGGVGGRDAWRTRLQRQVLLLPGLARGARTRSPRRAASTPPRIIRTTATASTGCSTTR